MDIGEAGTGIPLGDDQWDGPFPIGFPFPFYGQTFTEFYISSNGWLSFSAPTSSDLSNERLPSPTAPGNLIAMFWDDLNPGVGGQVRYLADGQRLVVSFLDVPRYASGGPYTFQAVLTPDGTITLQYLTMLGARLDEATIGIQNADGSQGLTVAHDEEYVHEGLAVRIEPPAEPHEISFRARLATDLAVDSVVTNTAHLSDGWGQELILSAAVGVNRIDLTGSTLTFTPPLVLPGEELTCTVTLRNEGNVTATVIAAVDVPTRTTYLPGSATGGAVYEQALNKVRWQGEVSPEGEAVFGFTVMVDRPLPDGSLITATAMVDDTIHPPFEREATATVIAPELSGSSKQAHAQWVKLGEVLTYTVEVRNDGSAAAQVTFSDSLPEEVAYVEGSAWAGSGSALGYDQASRTLRWQGEVGPQSIAVLRFAVQPLVVTELRNTATLDDGLGVITEVSADTTVRYPYVLFLPVMRDYR